MKLSSLGTALLTTALSALPALAQDANLQSSGDEVFLGTLRIEGAAAQNLLGNDEITEEEIEARNPVSVAEVFDGESSVTISGGAGIAQKVFVNGIEESLLSVTIDGARQNKSAFHHTGNVLIDPTLLKSVEVSEGIAPADAGQGALAGGLAYTTKDARDLLEDGATMGGLLSFGMSSNGVDLRRSATVFGAQGGLEYLLSATRVTGSDYEDGSGTTMEGTEAAISDYVLKLAYTAEGGQRFSFSASETKDTGTRAGQPGPGGLFFIRPDFAGTNDRTTFLPVTNVPIEGLSRRTSYNFVYTDEDTDGFTPTVQLSYNEQEIDASGVEGTNTALAGKVEGEWDMANGTLTAGIDFFKETAEGQGNGPGTLGSSGKETLDSVGVYAQARQDLSDRVSVSYGARYDQQVFTAATGQEFKDGGLAVNGSIDVTLSDTVSLNAGLSSGWGGYDLGEAALINFGGAWQYNGFRASDAQSGRIGLRYDDGTWAASVAYFQTKITDLATVLPSPATGRDRGVLNDVDSKGIDASLSYTGDRGYLRVNYTDADVKVNGAPASTTAYYIARPVGKIFALEAGYDVNDNWSVGGTAEIALENNDTATPLPGYEVFNLHATYTPARIDGMTVRFDLRNIFDETYARRSSDGLNNAAVQQLNEPGRTVALTANWRF